MVIFWALMAAGLVAGVTLGSIAWYSSKKPAGWEGAETPGWVRKMTPKSLEQTGDQG
ncbi:photosystem II assembly protein Psb35 [Gloeobacter kilaueensis]|uniref:Uncharacterized protein n=1 Tax=Gloeobacter kilaueensis (strain ATCC BAA-2537 / CCAP 1431/1 / ULC 316 / JS1) TaxID=1183438 RepID=U5QKT3_GLOK1|nr:hypothetical protein [Gloeobacter kilaueensis]AGY59473.1 hypothetical protein GKIL_3227 [Gloeobacter kilaueensis JS1]